MANFTCEPDRIWNSLEEGPLGKAVEVILILLIVVGSTLPVGKATGDPEQYRLNRVKH